MKNCNKNAIIIITKEIIIIPIYIVEIKVLTSFSLLSNSVGNFVLTTFEKPKSNKYAQDIIEYIVTQRPYSLLPKNLNVVEVVKKTKTIEINLKIRL